MTVKWTIFAVYASCREFHGLVPVMYLLDLIASSAKVNSNSLQLLHGKIYTYLQNKRMRRCGVAPPPIIFERLKLPQQIIYRRKENLSESPNHQKY